jgi:hypothetical protein
VEQAFDQKASDESLPHDDDARLRAGSPQGGASRGMVQMARYLSRRPGLWPIASLQAFRLAGPDWWRKWPPLPLPTDELWGLRMQTAYGDDGSALPRDEDVVSYLEWCRTARKWRSG